MCMEYSLTDEDVWAYLVTKRDDEIVGYCADACACLLAQAVQAKYAGQIGIREVCVSGADVSLMPVNVRLPLTPGLDAVMAAFDGWTGKNWYESVTKAEFLQAWQAFLVENGKP
jgi:hypothetical protein